MPQIKANGLSFEVESFGKESDPAILMIMGFAAQMTLWPVELCTGLASRGYRVIRFDNRDIGLSQKLDGLGMFNPAEAFMKAASGQPIAGPYLLTDMANDAIGILGALGIKQAHIVGASMGGMIAQTLAATHPDKVLSLISIMSTTGRPSTSWRTIGSQPVYASTDAELRATAEREVDRSPYYPPGMARQLVAVLASGPRTELLKKVKAPTLVIHGGDDPLVPVEGGKDTADSIAGARLKIVPGMGHDFTQKLVPVFLREIADFVSEVDAKRVK